jgi:Zeta toxin
MMWPSGRAKDQHELVTGLYQRGRDVPCDRVAVMAGGLPGADKDAALAGAGVGRSGFLTVSIDGVLAEMAARGLIPPVAGLSPLEAADDLVHGEARYLAKRVGLLAVTDGRNLLLDISLASPRSAEAWMYALRFAGYAVTAVFADTDIEEAVRRSAAAQLRGEQEYRRGHGYGGRRIPAEAIRALAGPAAAEVRNRIRWASGARAAGVAPNAPGELGFAGSAVTAMLAAYRAGQRTLEDLGLEFRARRWPAVPAVCPPDMAQAGAAIDDPEPYVPGSLDDVALAYDLGQLSDGEYEFLASAAS